MLKKAPFLFVSLTSLTVLPACSDAGTSVGTGGSGPAAGGASSDGAGGDQLSGGATGTGGSLEGGGGTAGTTSGGSGGTPPAGGTAGTTSGGTAGNTNTGGSAGTATGGSGVGGGAGGSGGSQVDVDQGGKMNAVPGTSTDVAQDYLRLGEIRILNNNWGSEDLGCNNSTFAVFVDSDQTFGWDFARGDCASNGNPPDTLPDTSHPDFPQVEFGIHPFGIGDELVTSPEFSSTPLLPLQLKDITSASVSLENLNISQGNLTTWNLAMEFWLSEGDPRQPSGSVNVHTELMAWWGWQNGRWPCDQSPKNIQAGTMNYTLCHQSDSWADGWRYYQFRAGDGSDGNIRHDFTGTVDVKTFIDYLVNERGYSTELWLTRMEVGTEIDDDTSGRVSMSGVTFEVNNQSRSEVFGTP